MTGIAQVMFPHQANGSMIEHNGKVIGSELIGQSFSSDKYFHGRPSATTAPDPKDPTKTVPAPYNTANSGGSNLGPSNKILVDRVKGDIAKLQKENPGAPVPVDLVTTSASGLGPQHLAGSSTFPGAPHRQGAQLARRSPAPAGRGQYGRSLARSFGRAARALNVALDRLATK
jgi:potassium-transporting ATPase KdpC subunit